MKKLFLYYLVVGLVLLSIQKAQCQNNLCGKYLDNPKFRDSVTFNHPFQDADQKLSYHHLNNFQTDEINPSSRRKPNSAVLNNTFGDKLLAAKLRQTWDGFNWQNDYKFIYFYNGFEYITEWVFQSYNYYEPKNIDYQRRELYTYDDKGNLVIELRQLKDTQDWHNISRSFYKYDVNNYKILDSLEIWDSLGNWKASTKTIFIYDEKYNLVEWLQHFLVDGNYINVDRWLYHYDQNSNLLEERYQNWINSEWVTFYIRNYSFDNLNNNIELVLQDWNGNELSYTEKYLYSYDDNRNKTEVIKLVWQDSIWVNRYKNNYIYDQENLLIVVNYYYWYNSEWDLSNKEFYSYDGKGNKIVVLYQIGSGTTFYNMHRSILTYDLYNNLTSGISQSWDGSEWKNSMRDYNIYVPKLGNEGNVNNYWLANNYPNPFNNSTVIRFLIPIEEIITLKIYDFLGQEVESLLQNENKSAGVYEINWNASSLASGIYFYQLKAGEFVETRKMILLK